MKKILLFLCAMMVAQFAGAWYVVGSFCSWDVNQAVEMTKQDDGTYLLADYNLETGAEFKFIETRGWSSNLGPGKNVQPNTEYSLYSNGGNAVWQGETGVCDIILDATAKKMKVVSDAGVVEANKYYIYFDNSASNWSKVYVYAWGGADFGSWPGTVLTETTPEGYYIAVYEGMSEPTSSAGLVFNDGNGTQSGDLAWRTNAIYTKDGDTGKTYDGTVIEPEKETLTYSVTVPAGTPSCYIAGEMNGWSFTAMTMVDETHYTITIDEVTKAMKYKYCATASWDNVEMQADGVTDVVDRTWSESDVVAAWKGISTTTPSDPETLTYSVTVPAGTPACYIVGAFNEWASFVAMDKVDDTHFTITIDNVTKSSEYKYTCGESWDYVEVTAEGGEAANRTWSASDVVAAWKTTPSTEPETPETLTYNVTVPAGTFACFIAGEMNDWAFTEMTKVDDTHFTITFDDVTKSTKYKYTCGESWDYVETWADGNDVLDRSWSENDTVEAWKSVWSSVASVEVADVKVYGANGVLCVRAAEEVALNVYNAQGMLVKALVVEGSADINLAAGMYIVNGTKVLVY